MGDRKSNKEDMTSNNNELEIPGDKFEIPCDVSKIPGDELEIPCNELGIPSDEVEISKDTKVNDGKDYFQTTDSFGTLEKNNNAYEHLIKHDNNYLQVIELANENEDYLQVFDHGSDENLQTNYIGGLYPINYSSVNVIITTIIIIAVVIIIIMTLIMIIIIITIIIIIIITISIIIFIIIAKRRKLGIFFTGKLIFCLLAFISRRAERISLIFRAITSENYTQVLV